MATVYRGHDRRLGVDRAIKVLSPTYASKRKVRARFEAEARTMAVLDHPNIVRVYDVGSNDETAWIVMELIDGPSLLGKIKMHVLDVGESLRIAGGVLDALTAAHSHGVVHRDIKPHNILMSKDGQVRITDFGIARIAGANEDSFTKTGTVMGTWAFMAPEQRVDAKGVDHTADIYGLGASLFAMTTGQTPMDLFASDLDPEMLQDVPAPLVPLIRRATRYQRDERYPSAQSMRAAVDTIREQQSHAAGMRAPLSSKQGLSNSAPALEVPEETAPRPENVTYVPEPSHSDEGPKEGVDVNSTPPPYRPSLQSQRPPPPTVPDAMSATDRVKHPSMREPPTTGLLPPIAAHSKRDPWTLGIGFLMLAFVFGGIQKRWPQWFEDTPSPPMPEVPVKAPTERPIVEPPTVDTPTPSTLPQTTPRSPANKSPPARSETVSDEPQTLSARPVTSSEPTPPVVNTPSMGSLGDQSTGSATALAEAAVQHVPESMVLLGANLPVRATLTNLRPIDMQQYRMTVYYRAKGTARYRPLAMGRERITWQINIPIGTDLEAGIEYFIKAKPLDNQDGRLLTLTSATNLKPHRVGVRRF